MSDRCRWTGTEHKLPSHERGCEVPGCAGCVTCPERHCAMPRCGHHLREHEPRVCQRCIGRVRENLQRISDLCRLVPVAVTEAGVESGLLVLAGPVPEHSTHTARKRWALGGGLCRCAARGHVCPDRVAIAGPPCARAGCAHATCRRIRGLLTCPDLVAWLDNPDDERHPLWVLGTWDMLVAEHLGHTRTMRVTVPSAAAYIAGNLTDLARHDDFGMDELAREITGCLEHVEQTLAVGRYEHRGAPCPVCHASGRRAKPLVRKYAAGEPDDSLDLWVCPSSVCSQTWTVAQYARYVEGEYLDRADRLTARQIAAKYRISEGSVRGWASLGKVRRRGRDANGLALYDVDDTLRMRGNVASEPIARVP